MDTLLPKYRQISEDIISSIRNEKLKPGMKTPSENDIMAAYTVSNTTARKALQYLEQGGWAKRIKGKGTFVQNRLVLRRANKILSFTKNMLEAGLTPRTEVIVKKEIKTGYELVIGGRKYSMPGPVYLLQRIRYADDIPMLLEKRFINNKMCPNLLENDLTASLYNLYWNTYHLELTEILQSLQPIVIDAEINSYFHQKQPSAALKIDGVTFCGKEIILEMEQSIYRGDMYSFTVSALGKTAFSGQ